MAKLSAHGREVFRLTRERTMEDTARLTDQERDTVSIRSDLAVMTKLDVHFRPDRFEPLGRWHCYGWKKKLGGPAARVKGYTVESLRDALLRHGYALEGAQL